MSEVGLVSEAFGDMPSRGPVNFDELARQGGAVMQSFEHFGKMYFSTHIRMYAEHSKKHQHIPDTPCMPYITYAYIDPQTTPM